MPLINWEDELEPLYELIMQPIIFNDLVVTLLDVLPALHNKDWIVDEHRHPWFEFNYISEGTVYTTIQDHEFLVKSGQSYLIPFGNFHSHRHCNHEGDNGFCLRWQLESQKNLNGSIEHSICAEDIIKLFSVCKPYGMEMNASDLIEKIRVPLLYYTTAISLDEPQKSEEKLQLGSV